MPRFFQASARGSAHSKYTGLPFKTEPKMPSQAPLAADTAFKYLTWMIIPMPRAVRTASETFFQHPQLSNLGNSRLTKRPSTNYLIIWQIWGYCFRENDLCAQVRNNLQRGQAYLGRSHRLPHACTFFYTHVHPLRVSYCRSFWFDPEGRTPAPHQTQKGLLKSCQIRPRSAPSTQAYGYL